MVGLEEAFGKKWADSYNKGKLLRKKPFIPLKIAGALRENLIKAIKTKMSPESPQLMYPMEDGQIHLMMVESFPTVEQKPIKYGVGINFRWATKWLSAAMPEELGNLIEPDTIYVLAGRLKVVKGNTQGVEFYNFSTYGVISLDEIAKAKVELVEDDGNETTS